jgi:hypothetical protein
VDGIRLEQVDALTSVCLGGIIGIHSHLPKSAAALAGAPPQRRIVLV